MSCKKLLICLICTVILFSIFSGMSCRSASEKDLNVILIVIDCLRVDHLSCYGYQEETSPNIDNIARLGVKFNNAYSNSPWTKPSVATYFTSLYSNSHNAINVPDVLSDEALTIAEIMSGHGYFTFYVNGGNPSISEKFHFTQGFEKYIETQNDAADLTDAFLTELPELQEKKFFAYLHYMDAHLPYNRNKFINKISDKNEKFIPGDNENLTLMRIRELSKEEKLSRADKDFLIALYDQQIKYVDFNIKRIIQNLEEDNLLQDTVLIITADHGEEFWDHDDFEHGHTLYDELLRVPFIIYGGNFKPKEIMTQVRLIDLPPTILDIVHGENRFRMQGQSLLKIIKKGKGGKELPVFATGLLYGDEKYCLIKNRIKFIVNTRNFKGKNKNYFFRRRSKLELYDLEKDPKEQKSIMEEKSHEDIFALKRSMSPFMYPDFSLRKKKVSLDNQLERKLKALGYVK